MIATRAVAPTVIDQFEADADVVHHGGEPHAVDVDQHADEDHADGEQDLGGLGHAPAEQAAEVAGQDEADAGHPAHPAHQGDEAGEPAQVGAVDPADPLVGVAGQRDLGGQVGGDERPQREHRAGQQQRPHERRARGEVAGAETGEDRGGRADRGEADGERRQRADRAVESLGVAELGELGVLGVRPGGRCRSRRWRVRIGHDHSRSDGCGRCARKPRPGAAAEVPIFDLLITHVYQWRQQSSAAASAWPSPKLQCSRTCRTSASACGRQPAGCQASAV